MLIIVLIRIIYRNLSRELIGRNEEKTNIIDDFWGIVNVKALSELDKVAMTEQIFKKKDIECLEGTLEGHRDMLSDFIIDPEYNEGDKKFISESKHNLRVVKHLLYTIRRRRPFERIDIQSVKYILEQEREVTSDSMSERLKASFEHWPERNTGKFKYCEWCEASTKCLDCDCETCWDKEYLDSIDHVLKVIDRHIKGLSKEEKEKAR